MPHSNIRPARLPSTLVIPSPQSAGAQAARPGVVAAAPIVPRRDTARSEPPTHVVDAYQRGDFATVSEAIEAAKPGDRILVRPGLYQESLVVNKPLEIIGDGPVEDIEIRASDAHVLTFRASIGRVANLTLRQAEAKNPRGVVIYQGRLDLQGCDISSRAGSCVYVKNGADPPGAPHRLHDSKYSGAFVDDAGPGTLENNNGLGMLEDNDLTGNGRGAWDIDKDSEPNVTRARYKE
jgi:hypothetical protein